MMTSNKILIGFCILVFLLPAFMFMSLNGKIKKGEFVEQTVEEYYKMKNSFKRGMELSKPIKAVKIISPVSKVLNCTIHYSEKPGYSYSNFEDTDNLRITNIGDTVLVEYIAIQPEKEAVSKSNAHIVTDLKLSLSQLDYLFVNNAEVTMVDTDTTANKELVVYVVNYGSVNFGFSPELNIGQEKLEMIKEKYTADHLTVKVDNASVSIQPQVDIKRLSILTTGSSAVSIKNDAGITTIEGRFSDSTKVNASWQYLKKMLPSIHPKNK
jgi:hypothetical protein